MDSKADLFFHKANNWHEEFDKLRKIILKHPLTEELKWGKPCYSFDGSNIVLIQGFKKYCALLFFKGALLKDANSILTKPGENSQAARLIRFTEVKDIAKMKTIITDYIKEAIKVEKTGLKVNYKKITEYKYPSEFQIKLGETPRLKTAFESLTPGRQRAYIMYFSAAKQSKTRVSRINKSVHNILSGKGLDD